MLNIKDLTVTVKGKTILEDFNLMIEQGKVHALMGPNGSGKSTLAFVLSGNPDYKIVKGEIEFNQQNILAMTPDARAKAGIFLGFQYPVEVPGLTNSYFMKAALNAIRTARGLPEMDAVDFLEKAKTLIAQLNMPETLLHRELNAGFSGGEKKLNEVLQLLLFEPQLAILDESDSGLDIDSLKIVANAVNNLRNSQRSFLIITHYQRLLNYLIPDKVHIMLAGKIVAQGDKQLAIDIEKNGYTKLGG